MTRKIPLDAFTQYWTLGPDRSYQSVADHYGVSKRAITKVALKENWQAKIAELERKAHEAAEEKMVEDLEQMTARHVKVCKLIQRKALEALKSMPLSTAIEAVRALDLSIKQERLIRGEPTDRTALSVEDVIRREYDRWMVTTDTGEDVPDESDKEKIPE